MAWDGLNYFFAYIFFACCTIKGQYSLKLLLNSTAMTLDNLEKKCKDELFEHSCFKIWLQHFMTPIFVVLKDPELLFLLRDGSPSSCVIAWGLWNISTGLALQEGHTNMLQGSHFLFLQVRVQVTAKFQVHWVLQICPRFTALHCPHNYSKHEQKNHEVDH